MEFSDGHTNRTDVGAEFTWRCKRAAIRRIWQLTPNWRRIAARG